MADRAIEFDAADLADAILGEAEAATKPDASLPRRPDYLGPILLMLLGFALALALGLALQFNDDQSSPEPPLCNGLYASEYEQCCDDEPNRSTRDQGLFDAEERFADRDPNC